MKPILNLFVCTSALVGCKPQTEDQRDPNVRRSVVELFASGQTEIRSKGNVFFALFKKDYELKFDALPATGAVDAAKVPYVGSWYPQKYGGTGVKANTATPSALEKYDQVFNGNNGKATQWEQQNHTVAATDPNSGWAGHCNGYSASAQRYAEPTKNVSRGSTTFTRQDVKALLAEIDMSAKFYFLGGNRCKLENTGTLPSPVNRSDLLSMGECDDVNPGTFHVGITNWIGIQKHVLIFDISTKEQVWNYPHFKYDSTNKIVDAAEAMRLITGTAQSKYSFNPDAVSFRSVTATTSYSEAMGHEVLTSDVAAASRSATKTYTYVLELDAAGRIIGGEWVGASQNEHPDFIWVAFEPGVSDGSSYSANPNVDPKEVIKLWAESIGADPANPPLDIMQPAMVTDWGKFPKFDVAINGFATGAVYLGTTPKVRLTRREGLSGDVSVELKLDGKTAGTANGSGSDPVVVDLAGATPGIHSLEIAWKKSGADADNQRMKIHVF